MEAPSLEPEHVDHLWFDDGSIVLRSGRRYFRVHRSLLSRTSSVFHDMFSFAPDEHYEGLPLVTLHDDPLELADLLNAIYFGLR